jgi:predicted RNase H-like HicB family nuclease
MKKEFFTIIIENLFDYGQRGFSITFPELHNSIVLGENYEELLKGIEMTFEDENRKCPPSLLQSIKNYTQEVTQHK